MNILKTVLLKSVLVFGLCAFTIVNGFSGVIINEDLMRVASDSGQEIEEITLVKADSGEIITYRVGGVDNKCTIDISGLKDGCYQAIIKTKGGQIEVDSDCKQTRS